MDRQIFSNSKINNGPQAIGNHCPGFGQLSKRIILKFDHDLNQPEVFRMEDKTSGEYAYTDLDMGGLVLTQAEINTYLAMTVVPAEVPWYQPLI